MSPERRLSPVEVEALLADYQAGGRVGQLARVYVIHRTTVPAHIARVRLASVLPPVVLAFARWVGDNWPYTEAARRHRTVTTGR